MGAEAALAVLIVVYILGAIAYTGFLALSLKRSERRQAASKKLVFAFLTGVFASVWAATWWQSNYPVHLTLLNVAVFAFLPGLAIGTVVAELLFRIGKLYAKLRGFKA